LYVTDRELLNKTISQFNRSFSISNSNCNKKDVSVTLVWTDAPAKMGCTNCLINHLALSAKKESKAQKQYFPNGKKTLDGTNNVQRIRFPVTNGEIVHVQVEVNEKTGGGLDPLDPKQEFSLVVSGCGLKKIKYMPAPSTVPSQSAQPSLSTQPSLSPMLSFLPSPEPSLSSNKPINKTRKANKKNVLKNTNKNKIKKAFKKAKVTFPDKN